MTIQNLEIADLYAEIDRLKAQLEEHRICPVYGVLTRTGLEEEWKEYKNTEALEIAFLDIDDLKIKNSEMGQDKSNRVIANAFSKIRKNERILDKNLVFGRFYYGDEAIILAPRKYIQKPCERVQAELNKYGMSCTITIARYNGEESLTEAVRYVNKENQRCKLIEKGKIYWV